MSKQIFLDAPNVGEREKRYLNKAVDSGYVSTVGPFVKKLENKFAGYIGADKAVSLQSGTAALHMALYELGIGKGDEVILPALTFAATVNPLIYVGARPVFADVDTKTWDIDAGAIERLITRKTKAIIPVHLYGNPCDMDKVIAIAKKYNLYVIEDATESLGAAYRGAHTGILGDMGCFSFNGNKLITTGGGGMITGRDSGKLEHIKFLINQAKDVSNSAYHPEIGFNYRMTNIEASLGIAQMERLNGFLRKKREFNRIYREELAGMPSTVFQQEYNDSASSWWFSCFLLKNGADIAVFQENLKKRGIPTRRVFMPVTEFPPYKKYKAANCKNSYYIYNRGLCLPGSTLNSNDDIYYICKTIKRLLKDAQ